MQKKMLKNEKDSPQTKRPSPQTKRPSPIKSPHPAKRPTKRPAPTKQPLLAKRQQKAKWNSPQNAKKNERPNLANIPLRGINRFDRTNASTSFEDRSTRATTSFAANATENKREAKRRLIIKREMQEKLFKEKPELFEKRMIIIDGSNVARTYVLNSEF